MNLPTAPSSGTPGGTRLIKSKSINNQINLRNKTKRTERKTTDSIMLASSYINSFSSMTQNSHKLLLLNNYFSKIQTHQQIWKPFQIQNLWFDSCSRHLILFIHCFTGFASRVQSDLWISCAHTKPPSIPSAMKWEEKNQSERNEMQQIAMRALLSVIKLVFCTAATELIRNCFSIIIFSQQ